MSTETELSVEKQATQTHKLGEVTKYVNKIFKNIFMIILIFSVLGIIYWCVASDRYVSEAIVIVQNTETGSSSSPSDLLSMFTGGSGNKADQMILVEFLTSLDMLEKLDQKLNLKDHYSSKDIDYISRLKGNDIESFFEYYKKRVDVTYDEYSGVVRISSQAFDPDTAEKITSMLVHTGEDFMNNLTHKIADEQVVFLSKQVEISKTDLLEANQKLLNFQNKKRMISPATEVENYQILIADLEKQKSELLIKKDSLSNTIGANNQINQNIQNNIQAIDAQISKIRERITNANDNSALNELADEERLLKMDVEFKKEIYSSTLSGLAKGKLSAARLIKNVSILQSPSKPQYAMKPERIYNICATLVVMLLVCGMLQLLKAIILDHVD